MTAEQYLITLFGVLIVGFLVADLGYFNRKAHKISAKSALTQSIAWIVAAFGFGWLIFLYVGHETAAAYMSAYVTEKLLSVDNLFLILLIFNFFKLEEQYYHRVLFWGILGAIVFRAIFILVGAAVIGHFHWVLYIFSVILIYTGITLTYKKKEEHINFHENKIYRFAQKIFPLTANHHNGKFFVRENGKLYVTILFMIVLLVETTDIIFAIDSIPAVFSISQDPFVVFTSNIFAIMGLRALFFLIENLMHKFHHLQKALAFILIFIGGKMLVELLGIHISSLTSFLVIIVALGSSMILSVMFPKRL